MSHDPVTGEVLRDDAETPPMQRANVPADHERAADGQVMKTVSHTAGEFLDMLEDGGFSEQVEQKLAEVCKRMTEITNQTGTKTKGKVTLVIDLSKDSEHFNIHGTVTAKMPELPRPKSVLWATEAGGFSRFPPNQTQMFGRTIRRV